ncbi:MAG TPA: peptidoglycan DD-metalloendopeptidase family protein [Bacteroidales bacterium]|nr:peptidoglycan DD-metalloendopeptidase family protein [Bacteroidales bacterium]
MMKQILAIYLVASILALSACTEREAYNPPPDSDIKPALLISQHDDHLLFGIDTSTYEVIRGRIRRNQFLSEILNEYGITYLDIDNLISNSGDTFDVRNMKAGSNYMLLVEPGDRGGADYMIYEQDLVNLFILDFTDSLKVRKITRKTRSELKYSSGTIETSLWDAMINSGLDPILAVELSEIYAWTIDFFGLQKGDRFKIIYDEEYVDDTRIGLRKIYGAWFKYSGSEFYAIPLIQDNTETYFDLDGQSLRKAFLKAPLRYSRISSKYSNSRMHPILRIRRPHQGVDYAAAVGTPVYSIGDGRVIMAEYQDGSGRIVKVKHNSVYTTSYMHLNRYGTGITVGKYMKQGDIVGYVGSSGLSTGPHLDFRFYKNGYPVDPLKVEAPPVSPVSDENIDKFRKISYVIKELLDSME